MGEGGSTIMGLTMNQLLLLIAILSVMLFIGYIVLKKVTWGILS